MGRTYVKKISGVLAVLILFLGFATLHSVKAADTEILVPDGKAIILNSKGEYIIIDPPESLSNIPQTAFDVPTGEYRSDSIIKTENSGYIGSVDPVELGGIINNISEVGAITFIIEGSNISVKSTNPVGIDVKSLKVSSENATLRTYLNLSGQEIGIQLSGEVSIYSADILIQTEKYGVKNFDTDLIYPATLLLGNGVNLDVTVDSEDGMAISVSSVHCEASKIKASAPNGVAGIYADYTLYGIAGLADGVPTQSNIEAYSKTGRAISIGHLSLGGSINLDGSNVKGVTERGQAGVHAEYIQASKNEAYDFISTVVGSGDVGFGVIGQSLDTDYEFPSGSINSNGSVIEGTVNEGMGISSFMVSSHNSDGQSIMNGTANKGIGISVCSGYFSKISMTGISHGSTDKHFQVYDSIADSAGINFLSYLNIDNESYITGIAPKEDRDSFGIHGKLNNVEGVDWGGKVNAYLQNDAGDSIFKGEGGTGMYFSNLYAYNDSTGGGTLIFDAVGTVDGMKVGSISSGSQKDLGEYGCIINATGEEGSGISGVPKSDNTNHVNLESMNINASGVKNGFLADDLMEINMNNIKVNAVASQGDGMSLLFSSEELYNHNSLIRNSEINAKGKRYGFALKNSNLDIVNSEQQYTSEIEIQGAETAMILEFDEGIPEDQITGLSIGTRDDGEVSGREVSAPLNVRVISESVAPDLVSRKPAVSSPAIKLGYLVDLTEEYLTPISEPITRIPYMAYAAGQNIADPRNYFWDQSSVQISAVVDGIYSINEVTTAESVIGRRPVNLPVEVIDLYGGAIHRVEMRTKAKEYQVTFDTVGGQPVPENQELLPGAFVIKPVNPQKLGFDFINWIDISTDEVWDFAVDVMPSVDLELQAVWKEKMFTVSFDKNTINTVEKMPESQTLAYGSYAVKPSQEPTQKNVEFKWWSIDKEGMRPWDFSVDKVVSDITLYAHWINDETTNPSPSPGSTPSASPGATISPLPGSSPTPDPTDDTPTTGDTSKIWLFGLLTLLFVLILFAIIGIKRRRGNVR